MLTIYDLVTIRDYIRRSEKPMVHLCCGKYIKEML